jgi:hypothetical protein
MSRGLFTKATKDLESCLAKNSSNDDANKLLDECKKKLDMINKPSTRKKRMIIEEIEDDDKIEQEETPIAPAAEPPMATTSSMDTKKKDMKEEDAPVVGSRLPIIYEDDEE